MARLPKEFAPKLKSARRKIAALLRDHPGLFEKVCDVLREEGLVADETSPQTSPGEKPLRLRPGITVAVAKAVIQNHRVTTITNFFGDRHAYKLMAMHITNDLFSREDLRSEIQPGPSQLRCMNLAVNDVLTAIAREARRRAAEDAVIETHSGSDAPAGMKRGVKGSGLFLNESGRTAVVQAAEDFTQ